MLYTRLSLVTASLLFSSHGCRESTDSPATALVDGDWEGACVARAEDSYRVHYRFSNASGAVRSESYFADGACQDALGTVRFSGTYALQITTQEYLYAIDMFFTKVEATPTTAEGSQQWNSLNLCARQDWTQDQGLDITLLQGEGCRSFGVPRIEYRDVVRIDKDRSLIFGSDLNHLATRPLAVGEARLESTFYSQ